MDFAEIEQAMLDLAVAEIVDIGTALSVTITIQRPGARRETKLRPPSVHLMVQSINPELIAVSDSLESVETLETGQLVAKVVDIDESGDNRLNRIVDRLNSWSRRMATQGPNAAGVQFMPSSDLVPRRRGPFADTESGGNRAVIFIVPFQYEHIGG